MKKTLLLLAIIFNLTFLEGCEEGDLFCPSVPSPTSPPNDTNIYEDESTGYKSVTYIYYCLDGNYQAITWTRTIKCGSWSRSVFKSDCI